MALIITDATITSDQSAHIARRSPGHSRGWQVSWLPGQILDRDTATTAMILADIAGKRDLHHGHRLWPVVERWAADLGLTGSDAITQASQPSTELPRVSRTGNSGLIHTAVCIPRSSSMTSRGVL